MSRYRQAKEAAARRIMTEAAARMKPLPADLNHPPTGESVHGDLILWMADEAASALVTRK